jgi:multidrug transporter EmrE-like cation transporter
MRWRCPCPSWQSRYGAARHRPDRRLPRIGWRGWAGIHIAVLFLAFDLVVRHWSLQPVGVDIATLLGNTTPIWVALAGFVFFNERFSRRFLIGLAVALGGVVLLVVGGDRAGGRRLAGPHTRNPRRDRPCPLLARREDRACHRGPGAGDVPDLHRSLVAAGRLLTEDTFMPRTLDGWLAVAGLRSSARPSARA